MNKPSSNMKKLKRWLKDNQQALQAANVGSIVGTYDGSGDKGTFQGVETVDGKGLPAKYELPEEISALIEAVAEELEMPGCANNEGGGGDIRLNVDTGIISHESYYYATVRNEDEHQEF
jgi:hypothetical protein